MQTLRYLIAAVMLAATAGRAQAGLIIDITGGGTPTQVATADTSGLTIGWDFTVTSTITVDGLGAWDEASDGFSSPLTNDRTVGLWNSDGSSLLASTTLTNASTPVASSSADGRWLFNDIPTITLNPGTYVLGVNFPRSTVSEVRIDNPSFTTISQITFGGYRWNTSGGFVFPGDLATDLGPMANLRLAAAVPEPTSLALAGFAGLGMAAGAWRRRRQQQQAV